MGKFGDKLPPLQEQHGYVLRNYIGNPKQDKFVPNIGPDEVDEIFWDGWRNKPKSRRERERMLPDSENASSP